MDELLGQAICEEFFDTRGRTYMKLWRTKKFEAFNYHMLERLYLIQKADFVRERIRMPKQIYSGILALNELRNALAHSFFPENRRVKPRWKGIDIFSTDGFDQFWDETADICQFFFDETARANRRWKRKQEKK